MSGAAADPAAIGAEARRLIRTGEHVALGTSQEGRPYVSLVAVAADHDASPVLMLSDLAQHSKNIAADLRVSLLFAPGGEGDPLAGPRLSLLGRAELCDDPQVKARFAARHPSSAVYTGFGDFRCYRVAIERGHFVAGFGRIRWIEREALRFAPDAASLAAAESEIVAHMNQDHADTVSVYAERLLNRPGPGWHMVAIDPEGFDLIREGENGSERARLDFPAPVLTPMQGRAALVELAQTARRA